MQLRSRGMLAAMLVTIAIPALAQVEDFILGNETGKPLKAVEISPTGKAAWVKAESERTVIAAGQRIAIPVTGAGNACKFDIRATFNDDTTATWSNIELCDAPAVRIMLQGGKPTFRTG